MNHCRRSGIGRVSERAITVENNGSIAWIRNWRCVDDEHIAVQVTVVAKHIACQCIILIGAESIIHRIWIIVDRINRNIDCRLGCSAVAVRHLVDK